MPFVITDPCIGTKDTACVDVCPVDCIHPRKDEPEFEARRCSSSIPTSASIAARVSRRVRSTAIYDSVDSTPQPEELVKRTTSIVAASPPPWRRRGSRPGAHRRACRADGDRSEGAPGGALIAASSPVSVPDDSGVSDRSGSSAAQGAEQPPREGDGEARR